MIIAEVGSVHDGSFGNAKRLIDIAKDSGAKYVKFQMHIAKEETLKQAFNPGYFSDENRFDYFERTSFSFNEWKLLIKYSKKRNINFMCSVFSKKAFDNLIMLGVKNIKIPSGELNNTPLLKHINSKKKLNIFLSTGMSSWKEIDCALDILSNNKIILMQCTSIYPCPENMVGLNIISEMKKRYGKKYIYGFSDHTQGQEASICSLVYGAKYIEKHITFSKKMYGSDAKLAMEPNEFKNFCKSIEKVKKIISVQVNKNNLKPFLKTKKIFEKNVVASKTIQRGVKLKFSDLDFKKSKKGIKAKDYKNLLGLKAKRKILKGQVILKSDVNEYSSKYLN